MATAGKGQRTVKRLSLEQFRSLQQAPEVQAVLGMINGGSFMDCHRAIYEAHGIWVEELVPVFQKFDALLVTRDLNPAAQGYRVTD